MSELEESMRRQTEEAAAWNNTRIKNAEESRHRLVEFRDLMVSKGRIDQAYSRTMDQSWVPEKRRLLGKPVPGHRHYVIEFKPASRGWVLWSSISDRANVVGGEFLSEDLHLFRFSVPPGPEHESTVLYHGLAPKDLVPSLYFKDQQSVIVLGDRLEDVDRWHGPGGLKDLASAARKYAA
jgi:hypothetical protein